MKIAAIVVLLMQALSITGIPLVFGKPRQPYGMGHFYTDLLLAAACIPVCGRALGWW